LAIHLVAAATDPTGDGENPASQLPENNPIGQGIFS